MTEAWRDPKQPVAVRVADLMARMSLREKVAQMYGAWLNVDDTAGEVAPHQSDQAPDPMDWTELIRHGLGQVTRVYGSAPIDPAAGARRVADLQSQIVGGGRFGIPAIVHEECLTGLAAWRAPIFPTPLAWGASFDPGLVERMAAHIGQTMRRLGIHQGLAPVLDVIRDVRWGRVEETIGEDPHLVGTIGAAYVRGLQSTGIVATLKHFVGYSASRAGRNLAPVSIGPREVADVLLPPFEMALRAGARSVMNNYTDIDGVPVAADRTLLTEVLRDRLGFDGTVVSDYFAIAFLESLHGVAADRAEAAANALRAGIDVELPGVNCYGNPLLKALEAGDVDEALIDRAVERVLRQKCELGLLDDGWAVEPEYLTDPCALDDADARDIARRLAERSIVLLRNESALPLRPGTRLAVVGPGANRPDALFGCYSFPRHVGIHHEGLELGLDVKTVVEALQNDFSLVYSLGCPVEGGSDEDIAAAAAVAADADVCVAVLGDLAGLFGAGTSGEGCDAADLRLPGRQEELLEALLATGTPVVLVVLAGRPYELSRQVDRLAAAVCTFFPGEQGAAALAGVLTGRVNPSGRLPVGFPGAGASQPAPYLAAPLGRLSEVSTVDPSQLFPFGHGLSYADAEWGAVSLHSPDGWATDGEVEVTVPLHNPADREVSTVVQIYLHDPVAEVARPVRQLVAAPRVDLDPGESRTLVVTLHADLLSYTGRDGRRRVEPGDIELLVARSSTDVHTALPVPVVGPVRHVGASRRLNHTARVI
ncbi:beta-glucosidase [Dactylosporangium matsuzakiense]|uniref:beta-xylosidase/alpha-l-arabinosidase n=1 Tax=Dactylosporangium matsuzakiense TaxID=53360 RepID=UPI0021C458C9|nr:glycoside hydrolase family 3 N-terminal domain-containing protein [Dactylosporangium matsuzakiense]UWZ41905.1 glycoside hydrolase family 3 C-terminal domain-containing protein [Dactylosporangium matsuzakiense]